MIDVGRVGPDNGAEVVMIFDTAAGELSPNLFISEVLPQLEKLTARTGDRIGYYSKGTQPAHLNHAFFRDGALAGVGVDHRWEIHEAFERFPEGFVQGNFDQALLLCEPDVLERQLRSFLEPLVDQRPRGWICGLGHGVLPTTPEDNVRVFVDTVREVMK